MTGLILTDEWQLWERIIIDYKKKIAEKINEVVHMDLTYIENLIKVPQKSEMGDYAFPCFQLSKMLRKAPNSIASDLKEKIDLSGLEKIETMGPYLNFFIHKTVFIEDTVKSILAEGDSYGNSQIGSGKSIVVEYSSPNIAKPFHVGHLFSTTIGDSLYKLLSSQGYKCIRINHLGDWGTQFGKLIAAYKMGWADEKELEANPIKEMLRIYVKFHEEEEKHPEYEEDARRYFRLLEDGEEEEVKLWQRFKDLSLIEFNRTFKRLKVEFDSYAGESFYSDKIDSVVKEIEEKGLLTESNGAKVVMLDKFNMPPCIIKKSDGATIYATRDLAAAIYRKNTYDFYKNIYVVGTPQALHFRQLFTTLKLIGKEWAEDCIHVGFGLVKFADRKLSTRKGDVIFLEDLLNEAVNKTMEIINEKNPELENKEEAAEKIGIGAVKFTYLKNNRERDMVFDWKEMVSFDGETGPYVQYSYARGKSVLRKAENVSFDVDFSKLTETEEFELVKLIADFRENILLSIEKYEPSILTRYIIEVAKAFNKFYNLHSVLNAQDEKLKNARIKLVEACCQVIKNGLKLLGIEAVEKM